MSQNDEIQARIAEMTAMLQARAAAKGLAPMTEAAILDDRHARALAFKTGKAARRAVAPTHSKPTTTTSAQFCRHCDGPLSGGERNGICDDCQH